MTEFRVNFVVSSSTIKDVTIGLQGNRETCLKLMQDDDFATQYIAKICLNGSMTEFGFTPDSSDQLLIERCEIQEMAPKKVLTPSPKHKQMKKSVIFDSESTKCLLELRLKADSLFSNKKFAKAVLWSNIATDMEKLGFTIGENAGEKCRQKFANLQRLYIAYMSSKNQDDANKFPYFDLVHDILGSKQKISKKLALNAITASNLKRKFVKIAPATGKGRNQIGMNKNLRKIRNKRRKLGGSKSMIVILNEIKKLKKYSIQQNKRLFNAMNEQWKRENELSEKYLNVFHQILSKL